LGSTEDTASTSSSKHTVLLGNVLVVAACAIVYELLCGTVASYVLGDAVLQFSLVLGTYVFAMGIGAWLSKGLERDPDSHYVHAELALALFGGLSAAGLFAGVARHVPLRPLLYGWVFVIGALVGVELPLLVKILRREGGGATFGDIVARALGYDYLGALVASLLFPLLLVPHLGLVRLAVATGLVNALVALSATFVVRVAHPRLVRGVGVCILGALIVTFIRGESWVATAID
jgi:spermidine synthase